MKTVRTVTSVVECDEDVRQKPEFAVGDYMEVYCGEYQGHHFWIKDIRYNHDSARFEYLYGGMLMGGWYPANRLELLKRATPLNKEEGAET